MARAVKRPAEAWSYVLEADRGQPPELQSRFLLRPMTHGERAGARDDLTRRQVNADGTQQVLSRTRQQALAIALVHIVSIENFPAGAPKPWPQDSDERAAYLDQLEDDYVLELGNEVWAKSAVAGEDGTAIKNSSPPGLKSSSGGSSETQGSTPAPPATTIQG